MPRHKIIPSLYEQCIQILYNIVFDCCTNLDEKSMPSKGIKLKRLHAFLITHLPTSILDDLLELHYQNDHNNNQNGQSLKSYYFFRACTHKQMKCFKARNHKLKLCYWKSLFQTVFENLVTLNLALSCNDQLLELIPTYCPKLENLNATCKYERIDVGANACTFALSVTDYGLNFLCKCKNLRTITVNEPRSNSRCRLNGITYHGLRKLLIEVKTLEDISYSDLGSVISDGLERIPTLNLRILRHFNPTENSIREILRLCVNLKELYLTFFNNEQQNNIWYHILNSSNNLRLNTLEVINLNCTQYFDDIFKSIGNTLSYLSISNRNCITFSNLLTIGRYCKNLTFFSCTQICNRNELCIRPTQSNLNQFSKLLSLHIQGEDINIDNVLIYCTENAVNLQTLRFIEQGSYAVNVDKLFLNYIPSKELRHIEVSMKLSFTTDGIKMLIKKFPLLNYLNVCCTDDCRSFMQEIIDNNYDLVFINKTFIPFSNM